MKIIIFGVLCLWLWQAGANGAIQGDVGDDPEAWASYEPDQLTHTHTHTHTRDVQGGHKPRQVLQSFTEPRKTDEFVSKSLRVETPENAGGMLKLEAYLTKDGRIVSGQLSSLHDTVHGRPHVAGHQYITTTRPSGVRLNRPRPPLVSVPHNPVSQFNRRPTHGYQPAPGYVPRPAPVYVPRPAPVYVPRPAPDYVPQPAPGYVPLPQKRPVNAPPPPQYPQRGHTSQQELDAVVNNIVKSSVGPDGQQVSPQLVADAVNLLKGKVLTELAESQIEVSRQAKPTQIAVSSDNPDNEAFNYLGQLINQQIQERIGPILEQIPVPSNIPELGKTQG